MPTIEVEGRTISWVRDGALKGRPLLVLAHGAGASYHSPFMAQTAAELARRGIAAVRFHFPYMEEAVRTAKRRPPDPARRLLATWAAMLDRVEKMRGHGPVVLGGKSMGGRMASMLLADGGAPQAVGAVYLGYPLHPPGKPEKLRAGHLPRVPVPQLFVQGERDALCRPERLREVMRGLPNATLFEVAAADHSLSRSRKDPMAGAGEWLDEVARFVFGVTGMEAPP